MKEMVGPNNRKYLLHTNDKVKAVLSFNKEDVPGVLSASHKILSRLNYIPDVLCDYNMQSLSFAFIKDSGL